MPQKSFARSTETGRPGRRHAESRGPGGTAGHILMLQRHAGNRAVAQLLASTAGVRVQRLWDPDALATSNPASYATLLGKMQGMTAMIGKSRLGRLAAATDTPAQLTYLLQMGVLELETYLKSYDAATIEAVMRKTANPPELHALMKDLIRFGIDVKAHLATKPEASVADLKLLVGGAKVTEGLIAANGTEIPWTTVAGVTGDNLPAKAPDEKTKVKAAVTALDGGTLVGSFHGNNAGNLPGVRGAGGYTEYDVAPPPGVTDRGARRLVVRDSDSKVYYTWNHYVSFKRIR